MTTKYIVQLALAMVVCISAPFVISGCKPSQTWSTIDVEYNPELGKSVQNPNGREKQRPRLVAIQSYVYNLNAGGSIVRIVIFRDADNGDEYAYIRDSETGMVMTKLTASGH